MARRRVGCGVGALRVASHLAPGSQQVALQAAAQVATVLERPGAVRPARRPAQQLEVADAGGGHRALRQTLSCRIDRHRGVGVLVCIDANRHHVHVVLLIRGWQPGPVGGHA